MPRKTADVNPTAPRIIREQITQMAPIPLSEMESAPTNTDDEVPGLARREPGERPPRRKPQRRTTSSQAASDDLMDDPRYARAIAGLNFYGAPRILKRGFDSAASIMKDPEIALTDEEKTHIDDYFYALSKHTRFDPMASLVGRVILFVLLLGELILWRFLKYTPFGEYLKKLLQGKQDEETVEQVVEPKEPPIM